MSRQKNADQAEPKLQECSTFCFCCKKLTEIWRSNRAAPRRVCNVGSNTEKTTVSTQETFVFPLEFNCLSLSQEDWIKGYRRLDDPHLSRQAAQKQHSYKNISQTNKSNNSHSQNRKSAPWHSAHTALRIFFFIFGDEQEIPPTRLINKKTSYDTSFTIYNAYKVQL